SVAGTESPAAASTGAASTAAASRLSALGLRGRGADSDEVGAAPSSGGVFRLVAIVSPRTPPTQPQLRRSRRRRTTSLHDTIVPPKSPPPRDPIRGGSMPSPLLVASLNPTKIEAAQRGYTMLF